MGERIEVRDLGAADRPFVERLFGSNGACGGCWCMHWRTPKGADWQHEKGPRSEA